MQKLFINGGKKLYGKIKIDKSKNAILPLLAGAIMVEGEVVFEDVPPLSDVVNMCKILQSLGGSVVWQENNLVVDMTNLSAHDILSPLASKLRSSIFALGPLLSRAKIAKIAYPGGCEIGLRPIDIHLSAMRTLGAKIVEKNGYIYANGSAMEGADIVLDFPSVGATENAMMGAVLTRGITRIFNSAKEPEIVDLQNFLNKCGAKISGAGTNQITVEGVSKLHGCLYSAIPDRISGGSFLLTVAMCGGDVEIENFLPYHNQALLSKIKQTACICDIKNDKIKIRSDGKLTTFGEVETAVYPGFPTDLQPQIMALATVCEGYTLIEENLFESRFLHVSELKKMGADIRCKNNVCIVHGKDKLFGAEVSSADLRGGMALVMAGLRGEGYTTVSGVEYIDRGYYQIEKILSQVGADIKRIEE